MADTRIKLTLAEGLALVSALEAGVGVVPLTTALVSALGAARAMTLIRDRQGLRLTQPELVSIVKAVYPMVPGDTLAKKVLWLIKTARPAFATEARFQEVLAYIKLKLTAWRDSGAQVDPATGQVTLPVDDKVAVGVVVLPASTKLQPFGQGTIPFYCKTLFWWEDTQLLRQELALCGMYRVGYAFEMMGDSARKILLTPALLDKVEAAYEIVITEARRLGIWVHITGVNDNMGKGKYGDPGIKLEKCVSGARRLCQIAKKHGPANVIWTPAAETQTTAGVEYEKYCVKQLKGFILAYNGQGGHPNSMPADYRLKIQHEPSVDRFFKCDRRDGLVGDHSTFIKYMQGTFDGELDPVKNAKWFAKGSAIGYPMMEAYAFKRSKLDARGIASCSLVGLPHSDPVISGDIDLSKAEWTAGPDGSKAKTTQRITSLKFTGTQFFVETTPGTRDWRPMKGDCNQLSCLAVKRNGRFLAAKFDWQRPGNSIRDTKNIYGPPPYMKWVPKVGEPTWYFQMQLGTKERTTALEFVWK